MCTINDPRILNAYIAITEDEPTDWLLLGYKDTRDTISLYTCGEHGLSEFRDHITNEILFGFVRIEEKFILITYIPDSISGVRRARALVHSRAVAGVLELSHAQIIASTLSDLSDNNIRTRLKLEQNTRPRSRSSFVQQQRRRRSGSSYYSPSPSPVTFITDDEDDRMSATPTPSTPTSSVHSEQNQHSYFTEPAILTSQSFLVEEPKRLQDTTESMLQQQLAKKKEMEEARFKLFHKEQRPNIAKRIEEEQKRLKQQQQQKEIPKWQLELQQRKLKKQESLNVTESKQKPTSIRIDTANLNRQQSMPVILKSIKTPVIKEPLKQQQSIKLKSVKEEPLKQQQSIKLKSVKEEPLKQQQSMTPNPVKEEPPKELTKRPVTPEPVKEEPIKRPTTPQPVKDPVPAKVIETVNQPVTPEKNHVMKETTTEESQAKVLTPLMTGFVSIQVNQAPFWKRRYYALTEKTMTFYTDEMCKNILYNIDLKATRRVSLIDEDEEVFVPNSFMIETEQNELFQVLADDKKEYKSLYTTLKKQSI